MAAIDRWFGMAMLTAAAGCAGDDGGQDGSATLSGTASTTAATQGTTAGTQGTASDTDATASDATASGTATDTATTTAATTAPTATTETTSGDPTSASMTDPTAGGCGACDQPNQQCIDDVCVTACQGQDPDPCGPDQVCDVISGECKDPAADCTLAGAITACGPRSCGPGTVCDGVDTCLPISPCAATICTDGGQCWGEACSCDRAPECADPPLDLLNGPFSADISGVDFSDDCDAWSVTLSGGQEFLRRLTPGGQLDVWGGIGDYDMAEVKVLRHLTVPQAKRSPFETLSQQAPAPQSVEGYGEVALTYICCPTCGDCTNNPEARGVAHLVEDDVNMPLPIVIYAVASQGAGPFGQKHLDSGPQGLAWGDDRVLYVGNSTADGEFTTADLEQGTQSLITTLPDRVTASASVSPVHLLVAVEGGQLYLINTLTKTSEPVVDLMSHVTSLSHDAFTGHVYAGLDDLSVVKVAPFTGEVEDFAAMPSKGRVAVSPSGKLYFIPVKYVAPGVIASWDLPSSI